MIKFSIYSFTMNFKMNYKVNVKKEIVIRSFFSITLETEFSAINFAYRTKYPRYYLHDNLVCYIDVIRGHP